MRRKEKSITDRKTIDRIINESAICHLACSLDGHPYVIPLAFGYDGKSAYFHTSQKGKKNQIFTANPHVCLGFESNIELSTDRKNACGWSFNFQSVIATGEIKEIKDPDRKLFCLNQIMRHYSGKDWKFPDSEINKTTIWEVKIQSITGKRSPAKTMSSIS